MTDDEFYTAIQVWASGVAGIPFIQAYQNGARPSGAYGTFNLIQSAQYGKDTILLEPVEIEGLAYTKQTIIGNRVHTLSMNVYRMTNPIEVCNKLKASLRAFTVTRDVMDKANIGFVSASAVRRLPVEIDNRWEDRAQFDIVLNVKVVYNDVIESIEQSTITGEIKQGAETTHTTTSVAETTP